MSATPRKTLALAVGIVVLGIAFVAIANIEPARQAFIVFKAAYDRLPQGQCQSESLQPYIDALTALVHFEAIAKDIPDRPDLSAHRKFLEDVVERYVSVCVDRSAGLSFRCDGPCPQISSTPEYVEAPALPTTVGFVSTHEDMGSRASSAAPGPNSQKCANEDQYCSFKGIADVYYGANGRWIKRRFSNGVMCSNDVFGDPVPGVVKSCLVESASAPRAGIAGQNFATVYQHCNYGGYAVRLAPGRYDLGDLQRLGIRNDDLSAVSVPTGMRVTIFEHGGFRGRSRVLTSSDSCLVQSGFNDVVSAIRVESSAMPEPMAGGAGDNFATVYQHCNYGGYAVRLAPGRYDLGDLQRLGIRNDDLSAVNVPTGMRVTIFEHGGFRGRSRVLTSSDSCLVQSGFNDVVSAIRVE